ncbi:unnamed protein product [Trifolium pratense]|uniref:Uncharacterized protein n=1 Tax=Trifolium pratense TaxID=57577 RepID=A0ACB0KGF6_TRIPR|nr:unnamed protein product [Trifolium pratense]
MLNLEENQMRKQTYEQGNITVQFPATVIGRGLEPLDDRTGLRTRLCDPVDRILVVKTKKNILLISNIY